MVSGSMFTRKRDTTPPSQKDRENMSRLVRLRLGKMESQVVRSVEVILVLHMERHPADVLMVHMTVVGGDMQVRK